VRGSGRRESQLTDPSFRVTVTTAICAKREKSKKKISAIVAIKGFKATSNIFDTLIDENIHSSVM
jgi:hypothetical protein